MVGACFREVSQIQKSSEMIGKNNTSGLDPVTKSYSCISSVLVVKNGQNLSTWKYVCIIHLLIQVCRIHKISQ